MTATGEMMMTMNKKLTNLSLKEAKDKVTESLRGFVFGLSIKDVAEVNSITKDVVLESLETALKDKKFYIEDRLAAELALDNISMLSDFYTLPEATRNEFIHKEVDVKLREENLDSNITSFLSKLSNLEVLEHQKVLKLVEAIGMSVYGASETLPILKYIKNEGLSESGEQNVFNKFSVNARSRVLQLANILSEKNEYTILEALAKIMSIESLVKSVAAEAIKDFEEDIKFQEAKNRPNQNGSKVYALLPELQDLFSLEGYSIIEDRYVNKAVRIVKRRVEDPYRGLGLNHTMDAGFVEYHGLTSEQYNDIQDIAIDVVSDIIEEIKDKRLMTPVKFAKRRGGFPGTAKKTR